MAGSAPTLRLETNSPVLKRLLRRKAHQPNNRAGLAPSAENTSPTYWLHDELAIDHNSRRVRKSVYCWIFLFFAHRALFVFPALRSADEDLRAGYVTSSRCTPENRLNLYAALVTAPVA